MKKTPEKRIKTHDWEEKYQADELEKMPWFYPGIDPDVDQALSSLDIKSGRVWDLGTGPGTQAMALAKKGFQVTATDISATAVAKASAIAKEEGLAIVFRQVNVLESKLAEKFDFILDRGCFHVFHEDQRQDYVDIVHRLLNPGGYLFLKCFSHLEMMEEGPYRFSPEQINSIFCFSFKICSINPTVYQGNMQILPKALFCILRKK